MIEARALNENSRRGKGAPRGLGAAMHAMRRFAAAKVAAFLCASSLILSSPPAIESVSDGSLKQGYHSGPATIHIKHPMARIFCAS